MLQKTTCYCREAGLSALTEKVKDKCESKCAFNNQESCGREHGWILGGMIGAHHQTTHGTVSGISNHTCTMYNEH